MMFKEYISVAAEFLIIRQVSMAKNTAPFPRESEFPLFSCLLLVCSSDPFFFTSTRWTGPCRPSFRSSSHHVCARPGCPQGSLAAQRPGMGWSKLPMGPRETVPAPASCPAWDSKPRAVAEMRLSKHSLVALTLPAWKRSLSDHGTDLLLEQGIISFVLSNFSGFSLKPITILILCSLMELA